MEHVFFWVAVLALFPCTAYLQTAETSRSRQEILAEYQYPSQVQSGAMFPTAELRDVYDRHATVYQGDQIPYVRKMEMFFVGVSGMQWPNPAIPLSDDDFEKLAAFLLIDQQRSMAANAQLRSTACEGEVGKTAAQIDVPTVADRLYGNAESRDQLAEVRYRSFMSSLSQLGQESIERFVSAKFTGTYVERDHAAMARELPQNYVRQFARLCNSDNDQLQ